MSIRIGSRADIAVGTGKTVNVAGKKIALFNVGGIFYAIDNECKHRRGPLGQGILDGCNVTCPWHGWEYDVTTGASLDDPNLKLARYVVKLEGDDIVIEN